MKRANNLIEAVADADNLRLAFWKARKGKSYSQEVEAFRANLDENLTILRGQILRGCVEVGNYRYFKIYEPKERQICASAFKEQVLHHALMNVCHEYFEKYQIDESYASRKGKGTYAAIEKAQLFTKKYPYFLKLDVKKFFESIHHDVMKKQLRRLFKDNNLLCIFDQIIDSYEAHPNRGLPIGNLTSQYFANHFLASLDHFIKEKLLIKAYVRYMDDMVLWHDDKNVLKTALKEIENYIETELLSILKPSLLNTSLRGLSFLGYRIFPDDLTLTHNSKYRFIKKLKYLQEKYDKAEWCEAKCQRKALPLLAFTQHANTIGLRKKVLEIQVNCQKGLTV